MTTRSLLNATLGIVTAVMLTACQGTNIEGRWVEPVPGMDHMLQGMALEAGGKASSVNMATLRYETWKKSGNTLILTGQSIGNGRTLSFTDTLTIEKLTRDSLILSRGNLVLRYRKANETETQKIIPASVITPAKQSFIVKGTLIIGHEVRSFMPEGDSADYWVADETGTLAEKYDEVTRGTKNGTPVYAELEVVDMGKADDGFAADYTGVYSVVKIIRITPENDPVK